VAWARGVFTARRIGQQKTDRTQAIGGIIFGIVAPPTKAMALDPRSGDVVNHDPADHQIPVHTDAPRADAMFMPELDNTSDPSKGKDIGALAKCGAGAAIANAIDTNPRCV